MAVADEALAERVARVISWNGEDGSWSDVLVRAGRAPRRRRARRAGRTTLIAAALVLLGGSLALAVATRVVHELTGSPAPPTIEKEFAALPQARPSGSVVGADSIVASSARLLITLRTRRFGTVRLYSARTAKGGTCTLVTAGKRSVFDCNPRRVSGNPPVLGGLASSRGTPHSNLVGGRVVDPRASALRIRFRHGPARTVSLTGGTFLFELGPLRSRGSANPPIAYDVLDAAGRRIAIQRDPLDVAAVRR
jgi:hypothetical protein